MAKIEATKLVVNAFFTSLPKIFQVIVVCILLWLFFAIIGIHLLKGKFFAVSNRLIYEVIENTLCLSYNVSG